MLKSGSDFREFSELTITFPNKPTLHPTISVKCHNITSAITPCKQVAQIVEEFVDKLKSGQEEQIGFTNCDLEGRFSYLRTQECNLGNLITDIMRRVTRTDVAILNSGTMRSDTVHNAGVFKMGVSWYSSYWNTYASRHTCTCMFTYMYMYICTCA